MSAWYADSRGFNPHVRQHSFIKIGHEIICTAILSLPLIQEEQLSVTGERMDTTSTGKLPRRLTQVCVDSSTDRARSDLKSVEGPLNTNTTNRDQARNQK